MCRKEVGTAQVGSGPSTPEEGNRKGRRKEARGVEVHPMEPVHKQGRAVPPTDAMDDPIIHYLASWLFAEV